MALDTLVFGRVRSELTRLVFAHLLKERRDIELKNARSYQHKADDIEEVAFMAVYDDIAGDGARRSVTSNCAFPEDYILWDIDKIEIIKDERQQLLQATTKQGPQYADVMAIAILRWSGDEPRTRRLKIRLVHYIAGPDWNKRAAICQRHVEDLDMNNESPEIIQAVLAAESEPVIS